MTSEYIRLQNESGLNPGDVVLIVRKSYRGENGWGNTWVPQMNSSIGKQLIIEFMDGGGIRLSDKYSYPYFVLQKISSFIIPDYIKVGSVFSKNDYYLIIERIKGFICVCRGHQINLPSHFTIEYNISELIRDYKYMEDL